jgi:hypothetical protein
VVLGQKNDFQVVYDRGGVWNVVEPIVCPLIMGTRVVYVRCCILGCYLLGEKVKFVCY